LARFPAASLPQIADSFYGRNLLLIDGVLQLELPRSDALGALPGGVSPFVVGPENAILIPPLERLIQGRDFAEAARLFNPLMLVGPSGSGKSQLAQGIVRHWRGVLQHSGEDSQIEYFTAADFGRECQAAAAEERLDAWRTKTRALRLLVVEDLQRLRQRDTIQQELRNTIDAIVEAGGIVIATADREPVALNQLDAGLRDRLTSGLIVRIQRPALAAREAILRLAAHRRGALTTDDQLHQIARRDAASPAELLGRLSELTGVSGPLPLEGRDQASTGNPKLLERSAVGRRGATREGVEAGTRRAYAHQSTRHTQAEAHHTLKNIIAVTARYFSITQATLTGPSRRTSLVLARNIVVHLARRLTNLSYAEIGRALGGRDHTTIMHADRRLADQLANDPLTQQSVGELDRLLR
jgi:chromosomal replication initiator protein